MDHILQSQRTSFKKEIARALNVHVNNNIVMAFVQQWNETRRLRHIVAWAIVLHNLLSTLEYFVFLPVLLVDALVIVTYVVLWTLTLVVLYLAHGEPPVNGKRRTIYITSVCILSSWLATVILLRGILCNNGVDIVCARDARPRLRIQVFYMIVGQFIALFCFQGNRLLQLISSFLMITLYAYDTIAFPFEPTLASPILNVMYISAGIILILVVSYIFDRNFQRSVALTRQLQLDIDFKIRAEQEIKEKQLQRNLFINYIIHELRGSLNTLLGGVNLLEADASFYESLDSQNKSLFENFLPAIETMENIINDTLDYEQMSRGSFNLRLKRFNFNKTVQNLLNIMRPSWLAKGHQVTYTLDSHIDDIGPYYIGDEVRIRQVLRNYMSNAIKYTPAGGDGRITVKTFIEEPPAIPAQSPAPAQPPAQPQPTTTLRVEVADNGIGISIPDQEKLFKPYVQINQGRGAQTDLTQKGTGLGLSICAELLRLMGGSYGVSSSPQIGSTFWFSIPLQVSENKTDSTPSSPGLNLPPSKNKTKDGPSSPTLTPNEVNARVKPALRVLVTDDDTVQLTIMRKMMEKLGHNVEIAHDGIECIEKVKASSNGFDVIFIDEQMPRLSGSKAIAQMRADGIDIPIVSLTGSAHIEAQETLLHIGATRVLFKPVTLSAMRKFLDTIPHREIPV